MSYTYAGQYGPEQIINSAGRPLPSEAVSVYAHGTTNLVTLYTDRTKGTTAPNPLTTSSVGNLVFFVDPGQYDVLCNGVTETVSIAVDPAEAISGTGALQKSNNLSDILSASTARSNLGLGSAALHAATDFDAAGTSSAETTRAQAAEALKEVLHVNAQACSMVNVTAVSNIPQLTAGTTVIDSYTVQAGDTILLVGQTTASQNGPWVVPGSGSNATRPAMFASGSTVFSTTARVVSGPALAVLGNTLWALSSTTAGLTVDASNQTWNLQSQTPVSNQTSSASTITLAPSSTNVYTGTSNVTWNLPGANANTAAAPAPFPACLVTIVNQSTTAVITLGNSLVTFQGSFGGSFQVQPGQSVTLSFGFVFTSPVWYAVTGSVTNTPIFNVLLFGADPTAATECSANIQAAINAAGKAGGGIVYFPPGTYAVNSTLNIGNATTIETTIRAGSSGSTLNLASDPGLAASGKVTVYTGVFAAQQVAYTSKTGSGATTQLLGCTGLPTLTTGSAVVQGSSLSTYNGITLLGAGQAGVDNGFGGWQAPTTTIKWIGGNGGSVFSINGPIMGIEVQNLFVFCTGFGTAAYGFNMTAMTSSRFDNVFVEGASNTAYFCTAVNGCFASSVPAGNNQSNATLPIGSWQLNDFNHVGCTIPPTNLANGFRFTGDTTGSASGNVQGSPGCTWSHLRDIYIAQNTLSGTNQSTCFYFDFADNVVIEDVVVINTNTPGSASYYIAKYDTTFAPVALEPSANVINGLGIFGTAQWATIGTNTCFAPNVVKGARANFIDGTGPSTNLADPNIFNLRWDVPGGERVVFSGSTNFFTTNVAKQIDPVSPTVLYITCTAATGLVVGLSSSSGGTFTNVEGSIANWAVGAFLTVLVPAGWWVKCSGTISDFNMTAFTRSG